MSDEPEVQTLSFVQHIALTVAEWPPLIEVTEAWLKTAYLYGGTVEGETLRFVIGNGEAVYALKRNRKHGHGFVAELVTGNPPANLKARAKKYEVKVE